MSPNPGGANPDGAGPPRRAPGAVVFDLGNVLIDWDPHPAIAASVGDDEAARFLAADDFDFGAWNHEQDSGRPFEESEQDAVGRVPHWREHILAYRQHFERSLVGAIGGSEAVLRDLHAAGVRLLALTNWSSELFPVALERFDFLGLFEVIVVSGDERLAKPDPRIFEVLAERSGVPLADCVFVDDKPENVQAAVDAGMDGIVFVDDGSLRPALRGRGLPV
ncbi:MAG: HAD family phosphatase [Nocardioidaceae bacterium]